VHSNHQQELIQWIHQEQEEEQLEQDKHQHRENKGLVDRHKELLRKLKPLVSNNRQWVLFSSYLDSMIESERKTLEQSIDIVTMHRAQGAISAYQKIKQLREHINVQ
jgi:hypothetical protein